jgi:hypothetical protein
MAKAEGVSRWLINEWVITYLSDSLKALDIKK